MGRLQGSQTDRERLDRRLERCDAVIHLYFVLSGERADNSGARTNARDECLANSQERIDCDGNAARKNELLGDGFRVHEPGQD